MQAPRVGSGGGIPGDRTAGKAAAVTARIGDRRVRAQGAATPRDGGGEPGAMNATLDEAGEGPGAPGSRPERLLEVGELEVGFAAPSGGEVRVVHGVRLDVRAGEILGLVGESGSGKSVTFLSLLGLAGPSARVRGAARFAGEALIGVDDSRLARIRGRGIGMIFQDPMSSLNPVMSIGRQIAEALSLAHPQLARQGREAVRREALRLLEEVGMAEPRRRLKQFPHELSGGLNQRAMIAMMCAGDPRLLVADEPTTALDATVQAQILSLLARLRDERGMSIVLITHDLGVVAQVSDRVAVMYCGRVVEIGPVHEVYARPRHPYTAGLLASRPHAEGGRIELNPIPGQVPAPDALPPGCAFAPRCSRAREACRAGAPALCGDAHAVACMYPLDVP